MIDFKPLVGFAALLVGIAVAGWVLVGSIGAGILAAVALVVLTALGLSYARWLVPGLRQLREDWR
ncbi:hypothetical protein BRC90_05800 [Halobacteriales archaeon QS_4_69_34]|jgi:Flp pilus assembly protein TadB|nr:MAG: hypothetical protein BRC90_05800 [Halobacteriales archaeon QS_4_69_34]